MSQSTHRCDILIRGRVQGVGFRWWTRRQAESLGLRGTVRNRADGAVEVHAQGPADRIQRFRSLLERGPRSAVVEHVEPAPPPRDPPPDGFRIVA